MNTNNNLTSPNFGMAMRIKPEAKESLMKAPKKLLEGLKECGEELKDSKFVDLVVDNGPSYHIYDRGADAIYTRTKVFGNFMNNPKELTIKHNIVGGNIKSEKLEFPTEKDALSYLDDIDSFAGDYGDYNLTQTMNTIRAIEASRAYTAELAAQKAVEKAKNETLLNDLFSEFGS